MRKMKKAAALLIFILIVNAAAPAQTLNIEQARTMALANSRSLAKYNMAIKSSVLDERNQLYSMLPVLSADYSASMNYLKEWNFVNPADTFSSGASFSVTQIIFQGGKTFIQKAINSIATESVRKDALAEYFNVLDAVENAYYAALEAAATLEAEESSLQTAEISLSIAEIRRSSGMINAGDFLKAQAEKEARVNSSNQARRSIALSQAKLKSLTGIAAGSQIELEQIDFSFYEDVLARLSNITDEQAASLFEEFRKILAVSNPSLAKAALNSQRAEKNLSLSKRDFSPVLSASIFSTGFNYSTERGFNSTGSGGVTLKGSIPVDFWITAGKIEKNKIARDSAAIDLLNAENSLEAELQAALLNAIAQAGSVLSSRRSLEYTEKHFEYVMERYRLSQSSVSDLGDASLLLINSRNGYIKASYGFLQTLSKLRSLCAISDEGKLLQLLLK
ncbi:MAG: TolC family protein [Treponema sp.]|jgi:outer membrane protein TolC|nr:TolC family protein [Treponema sp.]